MEQLRKELPEIMNFGCDIKAKGVGYEVQRPKRSSDEPTVGDNLLGVGKFLLCMPLIERLRHGTEMERKTILKDVNATFKAGTTTLVLGAPGSGKVGAGMALSRISRKASVTIPRVGVLGDVERRTGCLPVEEHPHNVSCFASSVQILRKARLPFGCRVWWESK